MLAVLEAIDHDHGGVLAWLSAQGWTADDTERLTARLVATELETLDVGVTQT